MGTQLIGYQDGDSTKSSAAKEITITTASTKTLLDVNEGALSSITTGSKTGIGASAVQMTTTSLTLSRGVLVKASASNAGTVYVGKEGVTNGTEATDGYELSAKEKVFIPINNVNLVYIIASQADQKVHWLAY